MVAAGIAERGTAAQRTKQHLLYEERVSALTTNALLS